MLGKFLLNTVETYRVSTISDVEALHEDFKTDDRYEIASFSYTTKYDKKEDVEYQVVKVKKVFNAEKVLTNKIDINYVEGQGVEF